nr:hypothetical protein [Sphingomonas quercus]
MAAILAVVLLLRGRRQRVALSEQPVAEPERRTFAPTPREAKPAGPVMPRPEPEVAAAKAGTPPVGLAPLPVSFSPAAPGTPVPGDALTMLKGLGPKAAAQLNALGVTRFTDLAALDEAGVDALDAQMGSFRGRIRRDQWVEQARLLADGDRAAFEARYGKIS